MKKQVKFDKIYEIYLIDNIIFINILFINNKITNDEEEWILNAI